MQKRRKPFAETGVASSFKNRIENHSNGITDLPGVDHFGDLTTFQNQVLDAAQAKEAREKEKKREEARNGGGTGGRTRNSRSGSSQTGATKQEETVRYVNKNESSEFEFE
jgi:hypothetical protein